MCVDFDYGNNSASFVSVDCACGMPQTTPHQKFARYVVSSIGPLASVEGEIFFRIDPRELEVVLHVQTIVGQ